MKGYELIKEIQDGSIDDCKIKWILGIEQGIIEVNYGKLEWKPGTFATNILTNSATEFKAIEENKEIKEFTSTVESYHSKDTICQYCNTQTAKINELVRTVNKLIKESEEKQDEK